MRLGVVTDVHLGPPGMPNPHWHGEVRSDLAGELLGRGLQRLSNERVVALALLGDLTHLGDAASLGAVLTRLESSHRPIWIVPGNHDVTPHPDALGKAITKRAAWINLAVPTGEGMEPWLRVAGLPIAREGTDGTIRLTALPDVAGWDERPVLLLSHFPLLSRREATLDAGWKYAGDAAGAADAWALLTSREAPTIVLHGHLHLQDAIAAGPALQLGFGALAEAAHEVAVLDLTCEDARVGVTVTPLAVQPADRATPAIGEVCWSWEFRSGYWEPHPERPRHRGSASP